MIKPLFTDARCAVEEAQFLAELHGRAYAIVPYKSGYTVKPMSWRIGKPLEVVRSPRRDFPCRAKP